MFLYLLFIFHLYLCTFVFTTMLEWFPIILDPVVSVFTPKTEYRSGSTLTLHCEADETVNEPVVWFKNGHQLMFENDKRVQVQYA